VPQAGLERRHPERSHGNDVHGFGVSGQGLEVVRIRCQDRAVRFRMCHNESVDGGTASSTSPEQCSTAGKRLG
jgi:hypothetical protein